MHGVYNHCIADICQPAGYRLAGGSREAVAKRKHDVTWLLSTNRHCCNS